MLKLVEVKRCDWIQGKPDYYVHYHDHIWGKPEYDDQALYKWLILECFHTGLSWQLVLSKEAHFSEAFLDYDYQLVAQFTEDDIQRLKNNPGIIRHEGKIKAAINNAKAFMEIQNEYGSFKEYIWGFTDGQQVVKQTDDHLTRSDLSDTITKSLKAHGFKWVGSVTIYSYLQAIGIINDHDLACDFR
ncbi:DNA-3-methyladenine glycosylase I [Aerococcaceae bacterium DSM 111176]|nr:DNA-3-methyladenine glycosylase I [Aerococcaceae bacterium DSM 111176]